ncbi:hypothetical protein ABZ502_17640 [Streptomyces abikoensis]|uniref:hypothetical protein n=1 Tax=Streptomyces abikoensis TaxID=97398 RepID=UPI0033F15A3C
MLARTVPPLRQCNRYGSNGTHCRNTTVRSDRWCGRCDGFLRPDAQTSALPGERTEHAPSQAWERTGLRPLDSDEAHTVAVSQKAISQFTTAHGGSRQAAEAQIRSLLEDLLIADDAVVARHRELHGWRLRTRGGRFTVQLNRDASVVIAYGTVHRDRTYAQVKAGVTSRLSALHPPREKAWLLDLQQALPVIVTGYAARQFAVSVLGLEKLARDNAAEVIARCADRLESVRASVPPLDGGEARVTDADGLEWVLSFTKGERPRVRTVEKVACRN